MSILMENSDVFNYQAIVKDMLKELLEWALNLAYIAGQLSKVGVLGYHYGKEIINFFYMISKYVLIIFKKNGFAFTSTEYRFIKKALHHMDWVNVSLL